MIILASGENEIKGLNHIKYFLKIFQFSDIKFAILVRNEKLFKKLNSLKLEIDIFYAKSAVDVDELFAKLQKLKAIFYMSNTTNNIHLLRYNEYKHIFIGSRYYKRDSIVTNMLKAYDELWLQSRAEYNKLAANLPLDKMQIDFIGKISAKEYLSKKTKDKGLYIFSSFDDVQIRVLRYALKSSDTIVIKDNENNYFTFAELQDYLKSNNLECKLDTSIQAQYIKEASKIICDEASFNEDFLINNAQVIVYYKNNDNKLNDLLKHLQFYKTYDEFLSIDNNDKVALGNFVEYYLGKSFLLNDIFCNKLKKL